MNVCSSNWVCAEEDIVQRLGILLCGHKANGRLDVICVFYYFSLLYNTERMW